MNFLISDAFAEAAPAAAQDPGFIPLVFILSILAAFIFIFVWPQRKREREHKKLIDALTKGNEIVTAGGILWRVVDVDDNFVHLEVLENFVIYVQKHAVSSLMPKGTYKARKRSEK